MSFSPILSPYTPLAPQFRAVIEKEITRETRSIVREYEITVGTWKRKVRFTITISPYEFATVGTDNEIYGYVDKGTRPHIIRPKKAKMLRFNTVFRAKTIPNQLRNRAGMSAPPVAHALEVHHPGTEARNFTENISKRSEARFSKNMAKAMKTIRSRR
jgi:hypothetical protein